MLYKIFAHISFVFISIGFFISCESHPVSHSYVEGQDSLDFLVKNSDLISEVEITDGINQNVEGVPWNMMSSVKARVIRFLCGNSEEEIEISATPYFLNKGVSQSFLVLRNGRYILFLKRYDNDLFQATTENSMHSVINGKVTPVWGDQDRMKIGFEVGKMRSEIEKECYKADDLTGAI